MKRRATQHDISSLLLWAARTVLASGCIFSDKPLRPTQKAALEGLVAFLDRRGMSDKERLRGYMEIPTGIGKTALFGALLDKIVRKTSRLGIPFKAVVVAPTTNLLTQTEEDLKLNFPSLEGYVEAFDAQKPRFVAPIILITFDSWIIRSTDKKLRPEEINLVISDEAHHGVTARREGALIKHYDRAFHLAVTATAHYDPLKTVLKTHKNCIFERHITECTQGGELAAYIHTQALTIRIDPKTFIPDGKQLHVKHVAFNQTINRFLVHARDENTGDLLTDNQGAVFVKTAAQANDLVARLNKNPALKKLSHDRGQKAFAVALHTVGISQKEQIQRESDYKKGLYQFIVGEEKFKEGFNHPPLKTIIDTPHVSLVEKVQIVGRGTRTWYNATRQRSEGLTVVDTIIYFGQDNDEADEIKQFQAERAVVLTSDILNHSVNVFSRGYTAPLESANRSAPKDTSLQGLTVLARSTVSAFNTLMAVRQQNFIPGRGEVVDWTRPENRREFEQLWEKKGRPGGHRITKEAISLGLLVASKDVSLINLLIKIRLKTVRHSLLDVVIKSLLSMPDNEMDRRIDWTKAENRREFEQLWEKKGRPGGHRITNEAKSLGLLVASRDASTIHSIIKAQLKTVRHCLLDVVIKSLLSMPDKELDRRIDWTKAENRREFEQLWEQKGRPGSYIIYKNAKETGRLLNLKNHGNLKNIISGSQKTVLKDLLGEVIQTLHKMANKDVLPRVDWTNPENRREFEQLWEQKGRPVMRQILNKAKTLGFWRDQEHPNNVGSLISKRCLTISAKLLICVIHTLRAMPDRAARVIEPSDIDWTKPENRREFEQLWEQKGRPGPRQILNKAKTLGFLRDQEHPDNVGNLIRNKLKSVRPSLFNGVMQSLSVMPDNGTEQRVDWTDPKNIHEFEQLWEKKGNPGAVNIVKAAIAQDLLANDECRSRIYDMVHFRVKSVDYSLWAAIMKTLYQTPDKECSL